MLEYYPLKRAKASELLKSKWISMPKDYSYKMAESDYAMFLGKRKGEQEKLEHEHEVYVDTEDNDGDAETDGDDDEGEEEWFDQGHDHYGYKHVLNKSYDTGVYKGYADGIQIGELDREANWQFKAKAK